jgi:hypothetical protein
MLAMALLMVVGINLGALLAPLISPAFRLLPVPFLSKTLAYELAPQVPAAPVVSVVATGVSSVSIAPSATVVALTANATASHEADVTSSLKSIFQRWEAHLLLWLFLFALPFAFDFLMLGLDRYRSLVASVLKQESTLQTHGHGIRNFWAWAQKVDDAIGLRGRDLLDHTATLRKHSEQLDKFASTLNIQLTGRDDRLDSICDEFRNHDADIVRVFRVVRNLQADRSRFSRTITRLSTYSAGILGDIKTAVANRTTAFENLLNDFNIRLNRTQDDYTVVSQQLKDLSQQLDTILTERQLERTQMRDLELHLRAHVPANIYANNMFRDLEAKIPAGDTAGLIKAWMKAIEMQSEISNVNIKRVTEMVQALPSNPASREAPRTLLSTSVPVFAPTQTIRGPSPWGSSPQG